MAETKPQTTPEFKYIEIRERPSDYYLQTGNILAIKHEMTREQIEEIWPSNPQSIAKI